MPIYFSSLKLSTEGTQEMLYMVSYSSLYFRVIYSKFFVWALTKSENVHFHGLLRQCIDFSFEKCKYYVTPFSQKTKKKEGTSLSLSK